MRGEYIVGKKKKGTLGAAPPNQAGNNGILTSPGKYASHKKDNGLLGESEQARSHYKERPGGLTGTLMKSLSSHPRYYEQKTAAEAQLGRTLTNDEFERYHWKEPDSEIISGTSIFDPVLCELAYTWFCPPG